MSEKQKSFREMSKKELLLDLYDFISGLWSELEDLLKNKIDFDDPDKHNQENIFFLAFLIRDLSALIIKIRDEINESDSVISVLYLLKMCSEIDRRWPQFKI
ncbi:MAG: hypothetical protein ACTSRA_09065 [Promethearchaeota archaeon]